MFSDWENKESCSRRLLTSFPSYLGHSCLFLSLFWLGLRCCSACSLVVASGVYSLVVVCGLLVVVASRVVEHRLWSTGSEVVVHRLSCSAECGIFPYWGWNPCLLHGQVDSWPLSHQGSPHSCFKKANEWSLRHCSPAAAWQGLEVPSAEAHVFINLCVMSSYCVPDTGHKEWGTGGAKGGWARVQPHQVAQKIIYINEIITGT